MIGLIASAKLSEAAAQSIRSWSPVLAGVDGLLPFDPFAARLADLGRVEAVQDLVPLSIELSGRSRGHLRLEPHRPLVVLGCLDFLRRQVFSTPARDFCGSPSSLGGVGLMTSPGSDAPHLHLARSLPTATDRNNPPRLPRQLACRRPHAQRLQPHQQRQRHRRSLLNGELYRVRIPIAVVVLIAVLALVAGRRRLIKAYRLALDTNLVEWCADPPTPHPAVGVGDDIVDMISDEQEIPPCNMIKWTQ